MLKKLFLISLFIACNSFADTGLSAYALLSPKYPCADFLRVFNGIPIKRTAILDSTFGHDTTCLKKFLNLPGKKLVEIHISNEAGRHSKTLGNSDFLPNLSEVAYNSLWEMKSHIVVDPFIARIVYWSNFAKSYPHTRWLMSDGLESRGSLLAANNRISMMKKYWKGKIVYNTAYSARTSKGGADYKEVHDSHLYANPRADLILNFDGQGICWTCSSFGYPPFALNPNDLPQILREARLKHSLVFLWDLEGQNSTADGSYQIMQNRTYSIIASSQKNTLLKKYG